VDLNLWPRPLVIFASSNVFRSLTSEQQAALRGGAAAAVPLALSASRQEDVSAMRTLCARGKLTLIDLTHVQLQAFQNAVAPVYRRLERDASTRRTIREIEAMKRGLPVASNPRCAATSTTPTAPAATLLDGAWQMTVSASDVRDKADAGTYRFVLHRGRLQSSASGPDGSAHDSGTYRVDGGLVVFHITAGHDIGETWTYRWNIYRGALTFRRAPTGAAQGPANPTFAPWHRA
jgi:nitrogen fixation protein FixH